jgi:hypothetical protein
MEPTVDTVGTVATVPEGAVDLQPARIINDDRKKKRMELFLRKEVIFMELIGMKA